MKLEGALPIPRLTATIHILPGHAPRTARADVVVHGDPPRVAQVTRRSAHHCSRCQAAGRSGDGHNKGSSSCPSRTVA